MVADASAVLAILLGEADSERHLTRFLAAHVIWISPVNWWEVQVRMRSRYGAEGEVLARQWMTQMGIVMEPVNVAQADTALDAHTRYHGRPARLNLGDCFAYALAKAKDAPLIYHGNDFSATDVRTV